jgi:hypothetical protein
MTGRFLGVPTTLFAKIAIAFALIVAVLGSAYAAMIVAKSGQPIEVCGGGHWRVDANGKEWPVTIQIVTRPRNGTATPQVASGSRVLRNGQTRTVRLARVVYQSRKGFVGEDSFTYRRITADPTDTQNGREYAVAVTVR